MDSPERERAAPEDTASGHGASAATAPERYHSDLDAAIAFLTRWRGEGPWVLTAIGVDRKSISTLTFFPDRIQDMREWIEAENRTRNVYFHVNTATRALTKKAEKTDIASMDWLHVDLDPREGYPINVERDRIRDVLSKHPGLPAPTCVVFSGGGYQAYWKLREPVPIDGNQAKADEAKRYNEQIELLLGGDKCHNVDRIMRLPGTVNWPNAKKRARGQQPGLATVEEWRDVAYDTAQFEQAPAQTACGAIADVHVAIDPATPPRRISNLDELPEGVNDRVKAVIVQGRDHDQPLKGDNSRSEWLFFVVCALVRAGVDDATIYGIITDPDYAISASVLDKGNSGQIHRYAVRQIERAKEMARADEPILLVPGSMDSALELAQDALIAKNVPLFQRGGHLVMPIRLDREESADGIRRHAGALILHRPTPSGMVSVLVKHCRFVKPSPRKGFAPVPADPKIEFARVLVEGRERWRFVPLDAITTVPVFRSDGTILTEPGYDAQTRLWFDPGGNVFPQVKDKPTRDDALAALELLKQPFRAFPIPHAACRSTVWAAIMTPVILPTVPAVPGIGVTASAPGFGKTKLADCIATMATGTAAASMNQGASEEEDEKRIASMLLAGDTVMAVDNITRPVGGPAWCSVITNAVHRPRKLGASELPAMSSRVLALFNGNNLAFAGDITRRVLMVAIEDPDVENPEARAFDFDPVDEVRERRAEMIAAALTILRAWYVAGKCRPPRHQPLGSFEGWEPVRQALIWLGEADPVLTQHLVVEDDPQRESDRDLLLRLWAAKPSAAFRAAELKQDALLSDGKPTPLGDGLLGGRPWSTRSVGWRLRQIAGRWIDGGRLVKVKDDAARGSIYRIEWKPGREPQPVEDPEPF